MLTNKTIKVLKESGWTENRRVSMESSCQYFFKVFTKKSKNNNSERKKDKIKRVLERFMDLDLTVATNDIYFGFTLANNNRNNQEFLNIFGNIVDIYLFYIGRIGEHRPIFMDFEGKVYIFMEEELRLIVLGDFETALSNIIERGIYYSYPEIDLRESLKDLPSKYYFNLGMGGKDPYGRRNTGN